MSTSSPKRATSPEDKAQKKALIQASALSFLQAKPYDLITMNEIALHAKVAKGTLFNYFSTKEELFLSLLIKYYDARFEEFNQELDQFRPNSQTALSFLQDHLKRLDFNNPHLRLLAILHTQLLPNVGKDTADFFSEHFEKILVSGSNKLSEHFPELDHEKAESFLHALHIMVIGSLHYCKPDDRLTQLQPILAYYLNIDAPQHTPSNLQNKNLDHWLL